MVVSVTTMAVAVAVAVHLAAIRGLEDGVTHRPPPFPIQQGIRPRQSVVFSRLTIQLALYLKLRSVVDVGVVTTAGARDRAISSFLVMMPTNAAYQRWCLWLEPPRR